MVTQKFITKNGQATQIKEESGLYIDGQRFSKDDPYLFQWEVWDRKRNNIEADCSFYIRSNNQNRMYCLEKVCEYPKEYSYLKRYCYRIALFDNFNDYWDSLKNRERCVLEYHNINREDYLTSGKIDLDNLHAACWYYDETGGLKTTALLPDINLLYRRLSPINVNSWGKGTYTTSKVADMEAGKEELLVNLYTGNPSTLVTGDLAWYAYCGF